MHKQVKKIFVFFHLISFYSKKEKEKMVSPILFFGGWVIRSIFGVKNTKDAKIWAKEYTYSSLK